MGATELVAYITLLEHRLRKIDQDRNEIEAFEAEVEEIGFNIE